MNSVVNVKQDTSGPRIPKLDNILTEFLDKLGTLSDSNIS